MKMLQFVTFTLKDGDLVVFTLNMLARQSCCSCVRAREVFPTESSVYHATTMLLP
jgi:hypothetical protein